MSGWNYFSCLISFSFYLDHWYIQVSAITTDRTTDKIEIEKRKSEQFDQLSRIAESNPEKPSSSQKVLRFIQWFSCSSNMNVVVSGILNVFVMILWCHGVVDCTCDTEYEQHGFDSQAWY